LALPYRRLLILRHYRSTADMCAPLAASILSRSATRLKPRRRSEVALCRHLEKTWLLTIEDAKWRATGGKHVSTIGPLPIIPGVFTAQYMEAVFNPGITAPAHTRSGPEEWYTVAGETCLETPDGKQVGRAGGPPVIIPGMHLTATGTEVVAHLCSSFLTPSNQPRSCITTGRRRVCARMTKGSWHVLLTVGWIRVTWIQPPNDLEHRPRANRCSAAHASRRPGVLPLRVVAGGRNSLAFG